ncbi:hypothetical protein E3N88_02822 [Mikania micrantha]|uniref:C2H2-type domain-containing protein n=1 Tax=Mikania micrantha TaxID=192012 RepID=A0A5N6Q6M8_9ASTR|nr:hypothetical protein E3N88_02822 [Mikania micrantha]
MVETSSSSYSGRGGGCMLSYHQSPTISSEEEEDMANCLIMLAHSVSPVNKDKPESDIFCQKTKRLKTRSVTEMAATTVEGNSGYQSYECKTCNRTFPSFQALGGHRASHKKPKPTFDDKNSVEALVVYEENKIIANRLSSSPVTHDFMQTVCKNSIKTTKIHECSICGSEFLSGQALGGHMRRHRTVPPPTNAKLSPESSDMNGKSPVLSLDLNFPPPEFVFSATTLVDCHY